MKRFLTLIFAIVVAIGTFNASAQEDPSVIPGEAWRVITEAENGATITVHLHEKLAVTLHKKTVSTWTFDNPNLSSKIDSPDKLKQISSGNLYHSGGDKERYAWIFILQPLALGSTTLTIVQDNGSCGSTTYEHFTINVVE